ncbi:MAG: hypothetical protein V3V19_11435 [Cocleimonas sp.]
MSDQVAALLELEYDDLNSNNSFKTLGNKEDYAKWRKNEISSSELAAKYKIKIQSFYNLAKRIKERYNYEISSIDPSGHIKQVAETHRKIKKANNLTKQPTIERHQRTRKPNKQSKYGPRKGNRGSPKYSFKDHLEQELIAIGADPSIEDWQEVLLYAGKFLFISELSAYRKFIGQVNLGLPPGELKIYATISDKKAKIIRELINDFIGEWGTLHQGTAAESITMQQKQVDKLSELLLEVSPERLADIVDAIEDEGLKELSIQDKIQRKEN